MRCFPRYKAQSASTPFKHRKQRPSAFTIVEIKNLQDSLFEPSVLNDRSGGLDEAQ